MTTPVEPEPPAAAETQLADLLEECLRAECARPGSSAGIAQNAPPALRDELRNLLALAQVVNRSSGPRMDPNRRLALRARILARITSGRTGT